MASTLIRFPAFNPVLSPMYSGRNVGILYRLLASSQPTHYIYLVIDLFFIAGISSENIPAIPRRSGEAAPNRGKPPCNRAESAGL